VSPLMKPWSSGRDATPRIHHQPETCTQPIGRHIARIWTDTKEDQVDAGGGFHLPVRSSASEARDSRLAESGTVELSGGGAPSRLPRWRSKTLTVRLEKGSKDKLRPWLLSEEKRRRSGVYRQSSTDFSTFRSRGESPTPIRCPMATLPFGR